MATYLSNRDGGKTNEEGHYRFEVKSFTGNVNNGLKVIQNNPLSMSVLVEAGDARIPYQEYGYTWWNDGNLSVSINTADPSNPRDDVIVAYVDRGVTPDSNVTNNPDIVKIKSVAGSPSANPTPPNNTAIQTSVGAGNPYMILAQVRVGAGVSTVSNGNITDKRVFASPIIADGAVTAGKTAFGGDYSTSEVNTGFKWIDGKLIYKRTFTGTITVAANTRHVALITTGVANIIDYMGEAYEVTGGTRMIIPSQWISNTNTNLGSGYINLSSDGNVNLLTLMPNTRTNAPYAVTLWYTKV